jgi:hypothetical protein
MQTSGFSNAKLAIYLLLITLQGQEKATPARFRAPEMVKLRDKYTTRNLAGCEAG